MPASELPEHVDLLVAFANSEDHEEGTDDLTTPRDLVRWLAGHHLLRGRVSAGDDDLALARELRTALHAALVSNHDGSGEHAALARVASRLPFRLAAAPGRLGLEPVHGGVTGALTQVVIAVQHAVADDTWRRVKICSADDCRWAFYDATKNRSRSWCEWGCGNKAKTRSYRARKRADLRYG